MPVQSLESYLFERKLVNTSTIEILQNATVGIDVEHYLSRIYTFKKEQFLAGIGGIPSSLRDYIALDLQVFAEFNIRPIFVISGLSIQPQAKSPRASDLTPQERHLENSWIKLTSRQMNAYGYSSLSNDSFRLFTDPLPVRPMVNDLIKYFIDIGIDYMVAPYDAAFQLSYLYHSGTIDTIYGSTDLLMTTVDRFILGMEFQLKDFRYVDKSKVLSELALTDRQLLDLAIMVGCNVQPTTFPNLPPLPKPTPLQPYPQLSYIKLGLDAVYQYGLFTGDSEANLLDYFAGLGDPRIMELYMKGHAAVRFMPVMNKEGNVSLYAAEMAALGVPIVLIEDVPADGEEGGKGKKKAAKKKDTEVRIPNDVHDIISQRLPPELYYYQSIGLMPLGILEAITTGYLSIRPGLESGLSDSYKRLITSTTFTDSLDAQFNLVTQLLARYYQVKKISVRYWFKEDAIELNNRMNPTVNRQLAHLLVDEKELHFSLRRFLLTLEDNYGKKGDDKAEKPAKALTSGASMVSTALLRGFFLSGIVSRKNELSPTGQALREFVKREKEVSDEDLESLVLLLLLIRSKSVDLTRPNREYTSVPKSYKEFENATVSSDDQKHITLVSRIMSVKKFHISPINYQGPISRSLLNFRSHIKFIASDFINSIQCILVDMFARQENNTCRLSLGDRGHWTQLVDLIPFFRDCNSTLLGIVGEIYLEYAVKQKTSHPETAKEDVIERTHAHLRNDVFQINNSSFNINVHGINSITGDQLTADISSGFEFWSNFVTLATIANEKDKQLVSDSLMTDISATNAWLADYVK